ncbi:GATOR1 complex protein DEPDC5-like [Glandiceps talaboti]
MLSTTKQVKLLVHQKTFSEDELVLNPKEFPNAKVGDIVEIYHPEDDYSRLLLQVKSLKENKQQATKESVSVDQSIAAAFNLRTYKDVIVNIVNPDDVTLDLLELTFKDQYISRSDMWRLKTSLLNSCAYITRKVEFSGIRAQISELWSKGVKVACGNISEDTKVVFRSSTAMVYLFIQMSCEMWEFDVYGDLHLEKAIEFLTELFTSWKEGNTYHDLNIVLFSRTYYTANTIDEFPVSVRDCLQQDYKGRFYEDFYRIVAIGERRDDWRPILVNMKKVFNEYQSKVIRTKVEGEPCPNGYNSTSVQGNFLEAINMSLNVFDKHFVNRNFDRTGQLAILITPGAGVFEVDRELCNITKQRMIDNGIGSDLVCMAEQPLHAAPLFKFHNKMGYTNIGDDYNIPYWINHSFYTSKDQQQKQRLMPANFIPRIKLAETPTTESNQAIDDSLFEPGRDSYMDKSNTELPDVVIDHNAYDAQVFKLPSHIKQGVKSQYLTPKRYEKYADRIRKSDGLSRKVSLELRPVSPEVEVPYTKSYSTNAMEIPNPRPRSNTVTGTNKKSLEGAIDCITSKSFQIATSQEMEDNLPTRLIVGSASMVTDHQPGKPWPYGQRMQRALINPFAPSQIIDRLTSNKRRWTHTFPLGPTGKAIQAHHQLTVTLLDDFNNEPYSLSPPTREVTAAESAVVEARKKASVNVRLGDSDSYSASGFHSSASSSSLASTSSQRSTSVDSFKTVQSIGSVINTYDIDYRGRSDTLPSHHTPLHGGQGGSFKNATEGWYWGVTGEQEWSPLIQTGVDWKSVTWPACLPITTDYFPDKVVMSKMYVESPYDLLADEVAIGNKKLTTEQVFKEIVSQRLMQGCQLIVQPQSQNRTYSAGNILQTQEVPDYLLSIGRNYHKINLTDVNINVVRYRPRHIYQTSTVKYTYRLWPVDNSQYEPAYVTFDTEKLEEFNWNYLDNYVCTCEDYGLMDSLKYWRSRFLLLPSNSAATKKINDGSSDRCDIYTTDETKPPQQILEGFYKFVEVLNRIKKLQKKVNQTPSRPPSRRASSVMLSNLSQTPTDREMSQTPKSGFGGIIATSSNDIATVTMSYTDGSMPTGDGAANTSTASLDKDDKGKEEEKLNLDSPLADIIKAMKDPGIGMTFLPTDQRLLPENCFISGEAVHWLIQTLQDEVTEYQAVQLFQAMVDEERVCHASCLPKRKIPFKNGFFLYFITPDNSSKSDWQYRRYTAFGSFDRDWFEVAVDNNQPLLSEPPDNILSSSPIQWRTLQLKEQPKGSEIPTFGEVIYDVDINNKSDRVEWCHIRYHKTYRTDSAFELEVQWLVATGCLIMDMVQSWARKAGSCGFHLIPATIDPFGLNTQYSDPLRRPLFIDLECAELLRNCPQQVEMERVKFFQQEILKTFGFVQDPWAISSFGITAEDIQQFVHTTGSAFAVIPKHHGVPDKTKIRIFTPVHGDESKQHPFCKTTRTGFYWMHNFMLTKRWRSASTGDERFSEKLLTDFKQFCANKDGRLKALWDHVSSGWSV